MTKELRLSLLAKAVFVAVAPLAAQSALAEKFIKGGEEKWWHRQPSLAPMSLSTPRPAGRTPIGLEAHGLSKSLSSLEASGT